VLKKYCHLGFAADTPNGLVVPVVRDVWAKGITALAAECGELAKKARDGKLKPDEMKAAASPSRASAASAAATSRPSSTPPRSASWACRAAR